MTNNLAVSQAYYFFFFYWFYSPISWMKNAVSYMTVNMWRAGMGYWIETSLILIIGLYIACWITSLLKSFFVVSLKARYFFNLSCFLYIHKGSYRLGWRVVTFSVQNSILAAGGLQGWERRETSLKQYGIPSSPLTYLFCWLCFRWLAIYSIWIVEKWKSPYIIMSRFFRLTQNRILGGQK